MIRDWYLKQVYRTLVLLYLIAFAGLALLYSPKSLPMVALTGMGMLLVIG